MPCRSIAASGGRMFVTARHTIAVAAGMVAVLAAGPAVAQATITSVHPRACQPGATTRLTISGSALDADLRLTTSCSEATVNVEEITPTKATIDLTIPADVPLGSLSLWMATAAGPAEPVMLVVDDLPTVAEASTHDSPESAQPIQTLTAVAGTSNGAKSDYYQFAVTAGQRVAFEVLTQPLESTMDPVVRLLDKAGQTLYSADDNAVGPDCRFHYQFAQAGEYLLEVRDNRYAAGGAYHLRVGDFPILRHAVPMAVTAGKATTIRFAGPDGSTAEARDVTLSADAPRSTTTVATRLPGGQSSAWVPLYVTSLPSFVAAAETGPATDKPLAFPVMILGRLSESQSRDAYRIQGMKDTAIRIRARTRSLGSPTLLRMQLWNEAAKQIAETQVSEADEWSFDYTFPDNGTYRLEVSDLLDRGGEDFGYCIEIIPAETFAIHVKADANVRQQFAIEPVQSGEPVQGACAIDLQIERFGYDGEIELSLAEDPAGLRILNPRIAAGAKEARIYLVADEPWAAKSMATVELWGQATSEPELRRKVTSRKWVRVKQPHVLFPSAASDGVILLSGVVGTAPVCALEVAAPVRFARSLNRHTATLQLKRIDEAFKAAVTILPDSLPEGWAMELKTEQDSHTATWTRPAEASTEPDRLALMVYAEHQNRGRLRKVEVPLEWFDPLAIRLQAIGPMVAGGRATFAVALDRQGADRQAVTLKLSELPSGLSGPETVAVAADQDRVELELQIAENAIVSQNAMFRVTAVSSYQGQEFTVTCQSPPLTIIPSPATIEVHPQEIGLRGSKDRSQLIVTGYDADESPRDWTRDATLRSANPDVAEIRGTTVFPKANGETQILVEVGTHRHAIPLRVTAMETKSRTAFENEVLVALSKQGCNSGACHGSPSGKGMFRMSLRAFDRELDELTLIREDFGRRVNPMDAEQSLLLLKPLMKVSHGGGKQLHTDDAAYAILRDWIAEGAHADPPGTPRCTRLEVVPHAKRVLQLDAGSQQLAAIAHFSDGSSRDVTHLVAYESSNMSVGTVDGHGLVTPLKRGETVILVRYLEHIESVPLMFIEQVPGFVWNDPPTNNYIDELVHAKLRQMQYIPAEICTDEEFLRRIYLDVIGILPTVEESRNFLEDSREDKRARLIDQLLEREEYAKFWALKWGDLLRMTGKTVGDQGVYKYHRWVEEAFRRNMPYDEFARELLTASGSTLANPPANFYRTATDMNMCVETVSQVFLGARLQCAKCHNHPFERWTQDNYYGLGAFFERVKRRSTQRPGEMFIWTATSGEVTQPRTGEQMQPWLPLQGTLEIKDDVDRRAVFAEWMVKPENPYFAKIEANRIWAQLFARGIVDPIDDFRDSNPPTNDALLDALAQDFVDSGFDRQHLLRVILNSRTYQASCQTDALNRDDSLYFSHQQPRLLSAEQLLDALNQATGLEQTFGHLPPGTKATQLPAPDLVKVDFLKVFGQPERTTVCACERSDETTLAMAIEMFNGPAIHQKLRDPKNRFRRELAAGTPLPEVIRELYLAAVCRLPSESELQTSLAHCEQRGDPAAGLEDVCWALLNTDEFLFQH